MKYEIEGSEDSNEPIVTFRMKKDTNGGIEIYANKRLVVYWDKMGFLNLMYRVEHSGLPCDEEGRIKVNLDD